MNIKPNQSVAVLDMNEVITDAPAGETSEVIGVNWTSSSPSPLGVSVSVAVASEEYFLWEGAYRHSRAITYTFHMP